MRPGGLHIRYVGRCQRGGAALDAALSDSLAAIATRGGASLSSVAGDLADLATSVQAADAGPTQGEREAYEACAERVAGLIERWRRIEPSLGAAPSAAKGRR